MAEISQAKHQHMKKNFFEKMRY